MNSPHQKLKNTLRYTGIETLLYQGCLVIYQGYLYYTLGPQQYGVIGALFSLIYVGAYYANMGLDITLAPRFHVYKNKSTYLKEIAYHMAASLVLAILVITFLLITSFRTSYATSAQLIICCIIAVSESFKKTLKTVLHLFASHYQIACIEIGYIITYMTSIWLLTAKGAGLSFRIIMFPMFLLTWASIALYSHILYSYWVDSLYDNNNSFLESTEGNITFRIKSCIYQIMRSFYSTNFLVVFIATYYNIEAAGIIKLISSIYNAVNSMLRYMLSTTSSVMFGHEKYNRTATEATLHILQNYVYTIGISILCIAGIITGLTSVINLSSAVQEYALICIMLIGLLLLEHTSIMYESLLIVQEKILFLIACYGISILFVLYARYSFPDLLIYLYISIISVRCLYLIVIHYYTYYILHEAKNNFILSLFLK